MPNKPVGKCTVTGWVVVWVLVSVSLDFSYQSLICLSEQLCFPRVKSSANTDSVGGLVGCSDGVVVGSLHSTLMGFF